MYLRDGHQYFINKNERNVTGNVFFKFMFSKFVFWKKLKASNSQQIGIGSSNGLVPRRRQALIWTNENDA